MKSRKYERNIFTFHKHEKEMRNEEAENKSISWKILNFMKSDTLTSEKGDGKLFIYVRCL